MTKKLLITCTDSMMKQFLEQHVKWLLTEGWEVDAACSEVLDRFSEIENDLKGSVKLYRLSMKRSPFSSANLTGYRELRRIIARGNYDLIWTNEPVIGAVTRLAARKARKRGTKVIYMVHGFHFYQGAPKKNWAVYYPIEKFLQRYTDKMITINEEDYQFAKDHFKCPVYRIHGIGADTTKFHPADPQQRDVLKREMGLTGPVILNVGELNPNKNQKIAIAAFRKILDFHPNAHLLIAGKGPDLNSLMELVRKEGLEENVTFLGYTLELEKYMWVSDAEIACSYREGLPLNVIEAMLCGLPVAASPNRGHREIIREGINGFLVRDPDDADSYASCIKKLLNFHDIDHKTIRKSVNKYTDKVVSSELSHIFLYAN